MKIHLPFIPEKPRVAVLRLYGVIAGGSERINDASVARSIEKAFKSKPAAVALDINSPGGSPVQSSLIAARIRRLADRHNIPVYAFCQDVAASGGYWLACAGDEIYADRGSIIGSIGVIAGGFGLDEFIARHGIERRIYTAGVSKSQLDPFKPENPDDVARHKVLLDQLHAYFIEYVQSRRKELLSDADVFDGSYWLGEQAHKLGLIDGVGHLVPLMQDKFGPDVKFVQFAAKRPFLRRFGAQIAMDTIGAVEDRALFARFGL